VISALLFVVVGAVALAIAVNVAVLVDAVLRRIRRGSTERGE
jgi:hypothetical protein